MSPSLEGVMFNRSANLSARRPLLGDSHARMPALVPPRERNGLHYDAGPPPLPRQGSIRPPPYPPEAFAPPRPNFWKPTNVEIEKRLRNAPLQEKVGYFNSKVRTPDLSLDRRDPELVFRFDPHGSVDYLTNQYHSPSVQYTRYPQPTNGYGPPRLPERDGPFVFGVHSPSNFPSTGQQTDEDYDYSEVSEDNGKTVIPASVSGDTICCDKVNEWTTRDKAKSKRTLNRMFQIKDKRKVKGESKKENIKCVLVGDGAVGKTSLITAYAQDRFREDYIPTAYDTFNVVVDVDDRPISVEICDTAGQDSMSELRALCYPGTDVLMLCFSVVRPETFRSVAERWTRAVRNVGAPMILVGTQSDLAHDVRVLDNLRLRGEHVVTEADARALASKINAVYVETSAKTRTRLKDAFDSAILAALPVMGTKKPFWKKLCCVN